MTDDDQVELVHGVLRAAIVSLADEHIASGLLIEGCGNFMAEILARLSVANGGPPTVVDQRLVRVAEEILRVARNWIAARPADEGYL